MKNFSILLSVVLVLAGTDSAGNAGSTMPEQIHISATEDYSSIVVTWLTFKSTSSSLVQYGLHVPNEVQPKLTLSATGTISNFTEGSIGGNIVRYVHRVVLENLKPQTKYDYRCGSPSNWSTVYTVHTLGTGPNYSPTFLVYGDFGYINAQSLPRIKDEVNSGRIDAIVHVGDIAYDLFEDVGRKGDKFMNMIEDVTTQLPYMTLPGNHEYFENFTDYKNRFSMPGGHKNIFYSWNVGRAHLIMFSTEIYYYNFEFSFDQVKTQYHWLENDLKQATTPEALAERPWIITFGHKPMYCSTTSMDDCNFKYDAVRKGLKVILKYGLEDLFYQYGVDLCVWAHEHIYERLWPIYDQKVMNGSYDHPYSNPKAPVHIVTGSAGCQERHDTFKKNQPEWVAFTNADYGFSRMVVHNSTHLTIEQISDDQGGKIVDSFTIIKELHGPQAYN